MSELKSDYSPAQTQMILCLTRGHECRWEDCLKCGYLRDEVKEKLNADQAEWDKAISP
ncbi:hypothetical protein LCGC14_3071380 [marine sediment metagenome]|uniref:Uncharacterized protein n=1 Tax=marine sediment metagenome TaxID=412755 RepID=A0A0F8WFY0_9ZZZZ